MVDSILLICKYSSHKRRKFANVILRVLIFQKDMDNLFIIIYWLNKIFLKVNLKVNFDNRASYNFRIISGVGRVSSYIQFGTFGFDSLVISLGRSRSHF